MLYFAATTLETDGAVMVTGSHNPPDYNGFKMMIGRKPFFGDDIKRLGAMALAGDVDEEQAAPERNPDVSATIMSRRLLSDWDGGDRMLKVVWDNGNGAAGEVLQRLVASLPGEHIVLNGAIDGTLPGASPGSDRAEEPGAADRRGEAARRLDIGIAFDGDADRIGVVDDTGQIMFGDQLMVLLARDVLQPHRARRSSPT